MGIKMHRLTCTEDDETREKFVMDQIRSVIDVIDEKLAERDFIIMPKQGGKLDDLEQAISKSKCLSNPQGDDYEEERNEFLSIPHPMTSEGETVTVLCQSRVNSSDRLVIYKDAKDPLKSFKGICHMENGVI